MARLVKRRLPAPTFDDRALETLPRALRAKAAVLAAIEAEPVSEW